MGKKAAQQQELEVTIRGMKEGDIAAIIAIDHKITGQNRALTYSPSPNNCLGGELAMSLVAETGGKIIGFLFGQIMESSYKAMDVALAQTIGIDPAYLNQGVGTKLMQGFIEYCKKRGVDSVHAMVNSKDEVMISFLRSMDFSDGKMVEFVKPLDQ